MSKEKVDAQSPDFRAELLARLRDAAPEAFAEGRLDLEKLKALLGEAAETRPERYDFTWAGKRDAIAMLQAPTRATLAPDRDSSVNFDEAQHVFIEGENLEVLKVLYRSYFGRVKLIYIDPPYNTGNDFIYPDDFADPLDHYLRITGQKNGNGDLLTSRPERNGRFHSAWLSMMYPRLSLARQLLSDMGTIFVSADDSEVARLRILMDEIFGPENFVAEIVWEGANKNDARQIGISHEYAVVYARSRERLPREWTLHKEGVEPVLREVDRLKAKHGTDYETASAELAGWFRSVKAKPAFANRRFRNIDARGAYKEDDPTAPGGRKFELRDPRNGTVIPLRKNRGWSFSQEEFNRLVAESRITFISASTIMMRRYLHETDTLTPPSVIYQPARSASERLTKLMGAEVFDFPKDEDVIQKFVEMATDAEDTDCIVIDFFAGSGTTGHAVLAQNAIDGGRRQFVLVQLPEQFSKMESVPSAAPTYCDNLGRPRNIAELAKERLRRALRSVRAEDGNAQPHKSPGLRCFSLAASNIRRWKGIEHRDVDAYMEQLEAFVREPLLPGWRPENVIWEVALREGFSLTSRIEQLAEKPAFFRVSDPEQDRRFTICLEDSFTLDEMRALKLDKEDVFICRDTALDDTLAANLALQCRLKVL